MNGVLATVLATPCTAPFLAPALGFALAQPADVLFLFLLTIGLGLASPFLLLAAFPGWSRWLPRPGAWMLTFKKAMGFLLMATTVWLVDVLSAQVSRDAVTGYLAFLTVVGVAAWIYGHWGAVDRETRTRWAATFASAALAVAGAAGFLSFERKTRAGDRRAADLAADLAAAAPGALAWADFAGTDVEALARGGRTVFIDFTASWCVTCKVYEQTVIETDEVKAAFQKGCVETVKADYTNEDPKITEWLKRFRRPGVPMYVILPAGRPDSPILLPDLLTQRAVLEGLQRAGPTRDGACPT
jgi:thiol:disulfide interchange protein DsbD